ncbi:hypothetical protein LTR62_004409 [Meristemomyces frigidus]|uniref:AB hydrolase-1 domain-containing protein n=1 Tax=Meristemomyces frigidus TaxID=1508187 RepID=A0AAN7YK06_9PEZI|nr:hypothetical protein LTR62_004409 [Meristemomyces frigidus]
MASASASAPAPTEDERRRDNSGGGGQKPLLARNRNEQETSRQEAQKGSGAAKAAMFPMTYKDGLSQWWAGLSPAVTEHRVLSYIPYLRQPPTQTQTGAPSTKGNGTSMEVDRSADKDARQAVETDSDTDPYGPRIWHSNLVELGGKNRFLNEFSVERVDEQTKNHLVMIHGYGAGLGFFYKNFEPLSRLPGWKLYALDLLGMGRSSRPPFRIQAKDREGKAREAENWFIDALEEWRVKRGIERMTLLGHSLGGYMAVAYALKYPGHLDKLILASPVGIPEDPYAVNDDDGPTAAEANALANEFAESQEEVVNAGGGKADGNNFVNQKDKQNGSKTADPPKRRPYSKWLTTLWDANISPFSLVRLSGPLGPRLVSGWTSRRFGHLPAEEAEALHDYSYSLFRQRGSGEYALAYILAPGAFARSPLIRRIQGVGRQYLGPHSVPEPDVNGPTTKTAGSVSERLREAGIPIVFYYGSHDWMDINGGLAAKSKCDAVAAKALADNSGVDGAEARTRENGSVKVRVIEKAGHHVYLEGCEQFNREVAGEMSDVEVRQKRLAGGGGR